MILDPVGLPIRLLTDTQSVQETSVPMIQDKISCTTQVELSRSARELMVEYTYNSLPILRPLPDLTTMYTYLRPKGSRQKVTSTKPLKWSLAGY